MSTSSNASSTIVESTDVGKAISGSTDYSSGSDIDCNGLFSAPSSPATQPVDAPKAADSALDDNSPQPNQSPSPGGQEEEEDATDNNSELEEGTSQVRHAFDRPATLTERNADAATSGTPTESAESTSSALRNSPQGAPSSSQGATNVPVASATTSAIKSTASTIPERDSNAKEQAPTATENRRNRKDLFLSTAETSATHSSPVLSPASRFRQHSRPPTALDYAFDYFDTASYLSRPASASYTSPTFLDSLFNRGSPTPDIRHETLPSLSQFIAEALIPVKAHQGTAENNPAVDTLPYDSTLTARTSSLLQPTGPTPLETSPGTSPVDAGNQLPTAINPRLLMKRLPAPTTFVSAHDTPEAGHSRTDGVPANAPVVDWSQVEMASCASLQPAAAHVDEDTANNGSQASYDPAVASSSGQDVQPAPAQPTTTQCAEGGSSSQESYSSVAAHGAHYAGAQLSPSRAGEGAGNFQMIYPIPTSPPPYESHRAPTQSTTTHSVEGSSQRYSSFVPQPPVEEGCYVSAASDAAYTAADPYAAAASDLYYYHDYHDIYPHAAALPRAQELYSPVPQYIASQFLEDSSRISQRTAPTRPAALQFMEDSDWMSQPTATSRGARYSPAQPSAAQAAWNYLSQTRTADIRPVINNPVYHPTAEEIARAELVRDLRYNPRDRNEPWHVQRFLIDIKYPWLIELSDSRKSEQVEPKIVAHILHKERARVQESSTSLSSSSVKSELRKKELTSPKLTKGKGKQRAYDPYPAALSIPTLPSVPSVPAIPTAPVSRAAGGAPSAAFASSTYGYGYSQAESSSTLPEYLSNTASRKPQHSGIPVGSLAGQPGFSHSTTHHIDGDARSSALGSNVAVAGLAYGDVSGHAGRQQTHRLPYRSQDASLQALDTSPQFSEEPVYNVSVDGKAFLSQDFWDDFQAGAMDQFGTSESSQPMMSSDDTSAYPADGTTTFDDSASVGTSAQMASFGNHSGMLVPSLLSDSGAQLFTGFDTAPLDFPPLVQPVLRHTQRYMTTQDSIHSGASATGFEAMAQDYRPSPAPAAQRTMHQHPPPVPVPPLAVARNPIVLPGMYGQLQSQSRVQYAALVAAQASARGNGRAQASSSSRPAPTRQASSSQASLPAIDSFLPNINTVSHSRAHSRPHYYAQETHAGPSHLAHAPRVQPGYVGEHYPVANASQPVASSSRVPSYGHQRPVVGSSRPRAVRPPPGPWDQSEETEYCWIPGCGGSWERRHKTNHFMKYHSQESDSPSQVICMVSGCWNPYSKSNFLTHVKQSHGPGVGHGNRAVAARGQCLQGLDNAVVYPQQIAIPPPVNAAPRESKRRRGPESTPEADGSSRKKRK